jgi:hypothetical protein
MKNSISYHTSLIGTNQKVTAGSFSGAVDQETVERITRLFSVNIKNSGRAVFVDKEGREVSLYFFIDPANTEKGRQALKDWNSEKQRQWEEEERTRKEQIEEIENLTKGMTHEEIINKLKK